MEVHHHSHHGKKKWTEYFWEFFMLFLAVTLGFFVENQREHLIEHGREKQYMQSLYDDLKQDSIELEAAISRTEINQRYIDSLLLFIHTQKIGSTVPDHYIKLDSQALVRLQIVFTDRTASQLKNSGNMRLNNNPALWMQYANIVAQCGVVLPSHLSNLRNQQQVGRELMQLIAKKYL